VWGKKVHEKKPKAKNLVTLSLKAEVRPSPRSRERDRIKKRIANPKREFRFENST
jgi:hypothetical protein